jgi:hypothetical protein
MARKDVSERLRIFDEATKRQKEREAVTSSISVVERGWTREEFYLRANCR